MDQTESTIIEAINQEFNQQGVEKMGTLEIVNLALKVFDGVLQKTPNFDQRKKKEYYKIRGEYEEELRSSIRDDNRLDNLRDQLCRMVDSYSEEIFRT